MTTKTIQSQPHAYWTIRQFAEELQLNVYTCWKLAREGKIPGLIRLGSHTIRIDVEAFRRSSGVSA